MLVGLSFQLPVPVDYLPKHTLELLIQYASSAWLVEKSCCVTLPLFISDHSISSTYWRRKDLSKRDSRDHLEFKIWTFEWWKWAGARLGYSRMLWSHWLSKEDSPFVIIECKVADPMLGWHQLSTCLLKPAVRVGLNGFFLLGEIFCSILFETTFSCFSWLFLVHDVPNVG